MGKTLPNNWVETTVGHISNISSGYGFPIQYQGNLDDDIPFYKVGDISEAVKNGYIYINKANNYISKDILSKLKAKLTPKDSLVFAKIGEAIRLNRRAILLGDSVIDNNVMAITFYNIINYKLGFYYFQTVQLIDLSAGNAVPSIRKTVVEEISFPLPPLPEQERIASKLDALFAQLDSIRTAMEHIPTLLKNFRQQVLTQAVTGKLTEEWREGKELESEFIKYQLHEYRDYSNKLPSKWVVLSFQDVVEVASNLVNPDDYLDYPLIAPDNIESMTGRLISTPSVAEIAPISPKHYFNKGSIIYSKIRPYLSKVVYVDFEGLCSADMYPLKTKLDIFYLYYYMLSTTFLSYATTAGERSVLPKINQKGLNIIPIPVPPLLEQQEIVRRVESLFTQADAIEQQYISLKQKIDNLPQAILHKAFKGELVEQLPSDGDARDLLRQIEELKGLTKKKK